jgi:hypothetical protein
VSAGARDRGMWRRAEHEELRGRSEQDWPQPPLAGRQRSVEVSAEDGREFALPAQYGRGDEARERAVASLERRCLSRGCVRRVLEGVAVPEYRGEDSHCELARG